MDTGYLKELYLYIEPYINVLAVIIIAFFAINFISKLSRKFLSKTILPSDAQQILRHGIVYLSWFSVLLYVTKELNLAEILMPVLGVSFLAGAAVALAVKDILSDAMAGLYLLIDKHFDIGDEIETMGYRGEITSVTLRKTRIRTNDATLVILPNGKIDSTGWVLFEKKFGLRPQHGNKNQQ